MRSFLVGRMGMNICLVILFVVIMGCSNANTPLSNEPPSLFGDADGQQIRLILGSYQWNNAIADAPSPDFLVKNTTVFVVKPNARLTLHFAGEQPDSVSAGLWINGTTVELKTIGDAVALPSELGNYVLSVWAKWSGNDRASYAAAIEVKA